MDFDRCQPPCSCLISSEDQHGKCIRCVDLAHARDAIFGISNCKYFENFTLKPCTLDSRFLTENLPFFLAAQLRRPPSSVKPCPGVWRRSSRPWRVSSFHFLSLHCLGVTAQILWSSFLTVVLHPARRHWKPFPLGWRIFYIPRPPTLRTSAFFCLH